MADRANPGIPIPSHIAPEHLLCPACGYSVYGLLESRCPECGNAFDWTVVERLATGARNDTFEREMYRSPVQSLLSTWYRAAFWPERIWQRVSPYDRPQIVPLLVFLALQALVFRYGWALMGLVLDPTMNGLAGWMIGTGGTAPWRFSYRLNVDFDFFTTMFIWQVATFALMTLFFDRTTCPPPRWPHVLRVFTYGTAFAALCPALWCILEAGIDLTLVFWPVSGNSRQPISPINPYVYILLGQGIYVLAFIVTWMHFREGYRRYLRIPHAWAVSALVLLAGHVFSDLLQVMLRLT